MTFTEEFEMILTRVKNMMPELDDEVLLAWFNITIDCSERVRELKDRLEQAIRQRMAQRGDTAIADNHFICELVAGNNYQQELFAPLKELLVETDLNTCLTPAHDETIHIPDKWNTTKLLALGRRYPEVQAVVDKARIPALPKLKFELKE